ncbi:MAG: electron transfer flavoprotein subunit beta/FixA family protein [Actinomycetota bacterium]|nr:electron transfer flavoprotein subunit beta/FixA family protein [Actinomycetota bacterium]
MVDVWSGHLELQTVFPITRQRKETMKVAVCVKQIPDPADPGELDLETKTLKRDVKLILDESDSYGVEMALQLVGDDGEVVLISMVPNSERNGLNNALAMGADSAVLVSDEALAGSDALGTAKVLAAAISRVEPDLVLAATESSDGYTGTVPEQIAELLELPSVTFAKEVSISDGTVSVKRQTEEGYDEVSCPLPALVSVTAGVVEPRYPSFKGIMAAKSKPVEELTISDLGIESSTVGWTGAGQEIVSIEPAPEREAGEVIEDEGDGHERILAFLEELKVI